MTWILLVAPVASALGGGEEAKLKSPNAKGSDRFGEAVAVSGDTVLSGSPHDDVGTQGNQGSVGVFVRSSSSWSQQKKLKAGDGAEDDWFGAAVALDGDTAVIGAPFHDLAAGADAGAAYVFARAGSTWSQQAKLTAFDAAPKDYFGFSVGVSGDTAVVGALADTHSGATSAGSAYVYTRTGTTWALQSKLVSSFPVAFERFAYALAIDGDTIVGGAPPYLLGGPPTPGSARVFQRSGTTWLEQAVLLPSQAALFDEFGNAVSISGDTIAVGAHHDAHAAGAPGGLSGEGSVYVFRRSGTLWNEEARLIASAPTTGALFGTSLSIHADRLAVGAPASGNWSQNATGDAFLFARTGTVWTEQGTLVPGDVQPGDTVGFGVAVSANTVVVGGPTDVHPPGAPGTLLGPGSAYVFRQAAPPAETYCTAGTSSAGCAATLQATGTASASAATGFVITATGVEGARDGLFYYGAGGRRAGPWGNGTSLQCVVPPVKRGGLLAGSGTAGQCNGFFSQDLNARWCPTCPKWKHNPVPCTWMQAQMWYRDPANTSNQTTSLSDAVEFWVEP